MYALEVIQQELKEDIERFGRVVHVSKGEILMRPEECMEHFFVILEGRVKISQINFENGKEQILYLLSKGDMYDIITLLDAKVHENVAMALDDVTLLVFPIELFREWIETKPSTAPPASPRRCRRWYPYPRRRPAFPAAPAHAACVAAGGGRRG